MDIAKRLMDFGFHPPTVYFPLIVPEALMIEPTETESKETLDAFCRRDDPIAQEARETARAAQDRAASRAGQAAGRGARGEGPAALLRAGVSGTWRAASRAMSCSAGGLRVWRGGGRTCCWRWIAASR
jgi:hypothetical protein